MDTFLRANFDKCAYLNLNYDLWMVILFAQNSRWLWCTFLFQRKRDYMELILKNSGNWYITASRKICVWDERLTEWYRVGIHSLQIDFLVIFHETCRLTKRCGSCRCFKTRWSLSCYLIPSDEFELGPSSSQRESTRHELLPNIISAISRPSWTSKHRKGGIRNSNYVWGLWNHEIHFHARLSLLLYYNWLSDTFMC